LLDLKLVHDQGLKSPLFLTIKPIFYAFSAQNLHLFSQDRQKLLSQVFYVQVEQMTRVKYRSQLVIQEPMQSSPLVSEIVLQNEQINYRICVYFAFKTYEKYDHLYFGHNYLEKVRQFKLHFFIIDFHLKMAH